MESRITAKCICLYFLLILNTSDSLLRVLVVFPMASKSHNILGQGVVRNLLQAGHEVVFFTSFPRTTPVTNLTEIDCSHIALEFKKLADKMNVYKLNNLIGKRNIADSVNFMFFVEEFHRMFLDNGSVKKFLSDHREKFDLVILEWLFSESIAGIPQLFECPFIWLVSTEVHGQVLRLIDEVPNPAHSVDILSTNLPPLTFWERAVELATACWRHFVINFILLPFEKSLYNRVFSAIAAKRGVTILSYEEAAYNASLMLINSHPSVGTPFKLPQNVKYIGGYHIDRKVEPLPKNLQKIMEESKHGVIYFSMGSNLQSKDMSTKMKESLVRMLATLKEDVIWKFEDEMANVPPNLHLVKWAPQISILAHPKLKLFITHGGQLSTTEAIHFGVPLIGLPIFGDQHINMLSVAKKGFGVKLTVTEDFTDDLKAAIEEVVENPEYMKKAKYLSGIYHDRMTTPGKELVYWAEHVVRSKGAIHLRSPASMVSWYQKMYLDLAAVLIVMVILLYLCIKIVWKTSIRRIGNKKKSN